MAGKKEWTSERKKSLGQKIATDWTGKVDWMSERKKKCALVDKTKLVTFAFDGETVDRT